MGLVKRCSLWVVVPFFLICGPFFGMLYLNRGVICVAYFLALWFAGVAMKFGDIDVEGDTGTILFLVYYIGGLVHGIVIALRRDPNEKLKWYSPWYVSGAIPAAVIAWQAYLAFV